MTAGVTNYGAIFCAKLEAMILAAGGLLPMVSSPSNFQQRSLQLLDALALAIPNLATPPAIGTTTPNLATFLGVIVAPATALPGGGMRYQFVGGASVSLVSVGPGSNIQFGHSVGAASGIWNSGGPLALQWDAAGATAQGNLLVGTGTDNAVDRLQVSGGVLLAGALRHTGAAAGFFGTAAIAKPAITGSRAGNAALASLLTQLAALGLITDTSTA
jgi:hypothetical protein